MTAVDTLIAAAEAAEIAIDAATTQDERDRLTIAAADAWQAVCDAEDAA